jgi:hypothetical protein
MAGESSRARSDTIRKPGNVGYPQLPEVGDESLSEYTEIENEFQQEAGETNWVYQAGEPQSALSMVEFMTCKSINQIRQMDASDQLRAARHVYATIEEWSARMEGLRGQVATLTEKRAGDKAVIRSLQDQVARLAVQAAANIAGSSAVGPDDRSRSGSPGMATGIKTIKLGDPEIFKGTTEPSIDEWTRKLKHKLRTNRDHYPDEQSRMDYTYSRVGGDALLHLDPRIESGANQYNTVEEMIETLFQAYGDQDKRGTAQEDFRKLYQNDRKFTEFWADFLRLSTILNMADIDQQDELRRRVADDIKAAIAPMDFSTIHELAKKCTLIDHRFAPLRKKKPSSGGNGTGKSAASGTSTISKPSTSNYTKGTGQAAQSRGASSYTSEYLARQAKWRADHQKEYDLGVCFTCKKPGHLQKECPTKAKAKVNEIAEGEPEEALN